MRRIRLTDRSALLLPAVLAAMLTSACVAEGASTDVASREAADLPGANVAEVEIMRPATDLRDALRPRPDLDTINTAFVFHNPRGEETLVYCVALDGDGQALGRARVRIPARGVRFMLASDLANGIDFIGSAECRSRARVIPTAFVLGAVFSDSAARINHGWDETRILFPIAASY